MAVQVIAILPMEREEQKNKNLKTKATDHLAVTEF